MKHLLLATALTLATTTASAEVNNSYWTNNKHGLSMVQEDAAGVQFASFETCGGDLHGITFYDADMTYKGEGYVVPELKVRVDKKTIHTFEQVEILKSEIKGVKYVLLADNLLLSEMKAGNTMRVQYNGNYVETYSLIGFTRAIANAPRPSWCDEPTDNDYFQDSNGNEYFRS